MSRRKQPMGGSEALPQPQRRDPELVGRRRGDLVRDHLAAILEATSDLVATSDPEGHILYLNRAARDMRGLSADADLSSLRISDLHPEWAFRLIAEEAVPTALRDGIWRGDTAILDRSGREIPVSQVVLAHKNADGEPRFFSTILRDMSAVKRFEDLLARRVDRRTRELARTNAALEEEAGRRSAAQDRLHRQNEILTTIIDASPVIFLLVDPAGRIEFVSKACDRLIGRSVSEATLAELIAACCPDPGARRAMLAQIAGAEPGWREIAMTASDGRPLHASWTSVRLSDASTLAIGVDMTESHLAKAELERLNAALAQRTAQLQAMALELTRAQEAERRRLAQLLHDDLQQLLSGARFSLQATRAQAEPVPGLAARLEQIDELLDRSIRLSRSLTADLVPPALYRGELGAALESLARQTQETHGLPVRLEITAGAEPSAEIVRVFVYQAARELLFNAAKHAGARQARLRLIPCEEELELVVEDDGIGFDPGRLKTGGGTAGGFGLFSIRERIVPLGGRLEIDSAPGQGSRFTLHAPLRALVARHAPPAW